MSDEEPAAGAATRTRTFKAPAIDVGRRHGLDTLRGLRTRNIGTILVLAGVLVAILNTYVLIFNVMLHPWIVAAVTAGAGLVLLARQDPPSAYVLWLGAAVVACSASLMLLVGAGLWFWLAVGALVIAGLTSIGKTARLWEGWGGDEMMARHTGCSIALFRPLRRRIRRLCPQLADSAAAGLRERLPRDRRVLRGRGV